MTRPSSQASRATSRPGLVAAPSSQASSGAAAAASVPEAVAAASSHSTADDKGKSIATGEALSSHWPCANWPNHAHTHTTFTCQQIAQLCHCVKLALQLCVATCVMTCRSKHPVLLVWHSWLNMSCLAVRTS